MLDKDVTLFRWVNKKDVHALAAHRGHWLECITYPAKPGHDRTTIRCWTCSEHRYSTPEHPLYGPYLYDLVTVDERQPAASIRRILYKLLPFEAASRIHWLLAWMKLTYCCFGIDHCVGCDDGSECGGCMGKGVKK